MSDQRNAIIYVAVQSVKGGAMNIYQASQAYGINYSTLWRHCQKAGFVADGRRREALLKRRETLARQLASVDAKLKLLPE